MKAFASISLRLSLALVLVTGTAGISVHQHLCAMMGASVSVERPVSCCGERTPAFAQEGADGHSGIPAHETLSRIPCCDDATQRADIETAFESAPAPRPALMAVTTLPSADDAAGTVLLDRLPWNADDISPHLRHSLAETVNNLLS